MSNSEGSLDGLRDRTERPMRYLASRYGREHLPLIALGGVVTVVGAALFSVPALVLGIALDAPFQGSRPFRLPLVPDAWLPASESGQFWLTAGIVTGSFLVAAVAGYVRGWALNRVARDVQHEIRVDTYDEMQTQRVAFFDDHKTGEITSVLDNDVNQLESFLSQDRQNSVRIVINRLSAGVHTASSAGGCGRRSVALGTHVVRPSSPALSHVHLRPALLAPVHVLVGVVRGHGHDVGLVG